ncbi:MAG: glycosyltransferase family 2 protein [Candidatus Sulfotelmatobacter sp.]
MDLSIVIVNWNATEYLRACLTSLYRKPRTVTFEVIVVDNGSYDGCEKVLREEFPGVIFVQSEKNLGFSRANNLGFSHASGELILFLNPDTEVVGDALERMISCAQSNSSAGAVGTRLLNTDGSLQTSCVQALPTIWNQLLDSELLRRAFPSWSIWGTRALFNHDSQPIAVEAISGACFMVRRSVFEQVGLFDEEYFMYSDDVDLSWKIKSAGHLIFYLNGSEVIHHGGKSSAKQESHFEDVAQREALLKFFRKRRGDFCSKLYRASMASIAALRMAIVICLVPLAGTGLQRKTTKSVLRKWVMIFLWAIGRTNRPEVAGARSIPA